MSYKASDASIDESLMHLARLTNRPFDVDLAVLMRKGEVSLSIDRGIHPSYELVAAPAVPSEDTNQQAIINLRAMKPVIRVFTSDERDAASQLRSEALTEGTREYFVAPVLVEYAGLVQLDPKSGAAIDWKKAENRSSCPKVFEGTVHIRRETICPPLILDFLSRTASRRAHHYQCGSLLNELRMFLLRAVDDDSVSGDWRCIVVCYQCETKATGLKTRSMTGTNRLPTLVAQQVHTWFEAELATGIPRSKIGRGALSFGSLVKVIARQGLNIVDGDQKRCFIQNRWLRLDPLTRDALYPHYAKYLGDPEGVCNWLAKELKIGAVDAKKLIISSTNMGGHTHTGGAGRFATGMAVESMSMARSEVGDDLLAHFADREKPYVSAMAALDWDREAEATGRFDSALFSNEWGGVVAFTTPSRQAVCFEMMQHRARPVVHSMEPYEPVLQLAKEKFPSLDWEVHSQMPTKVYMAKLTEVLAAMASSPARVRAIDTVVGDVLQGRQDMSACRGEGGIGYEVFMEGRWSTALDTSGLALYTRGELASLFGTYYVDNNGNEIIKPPGEPMQTDQYISKVCDCMIRYLPAADMRPLDYDMWNKLLFKNRLVFDFLTDEFRAARPEDRLLRTTNHDYVDWDAPQSLKDMIAQFALHLKHSSSAAARISTLSLMRMMSDVTRLTR
jgi:hypothetical protein